MWAKERAVIANESASENNKAAKQKAIEPESISETECNIPQLINPNHKVATFAGGCFWCMVIPFDENEGVVSVVSGYTGGSEANPSYEDVKAGKTGHLEAVQITYDASLISYQSLLNTFWKQIDPSDSGGQFSDRGDSYRTAIFYHDAEQKNLAIQSRNELEEYFGDGREIATEIRQATTFYVAEEYHQDFARKEPLRYAADIAVQERKAFIKKLWGEKESRE
jgi:methionine-S-sulfoxide reductase